jgi:DNA-binding transcriptional MerR regulator
MENPAQPNELSKKYFKIGEVSEMLGIPASTLRFWEKSFPQIKPLKTKKGDRLYTAKDLDVLKNIHYLSHKKGVKLAQVSKKVKREDNLLDPKMEAIKALRELKEKLLKLKQQLE